MCLVCWIIRETSKNMVLSVVNRSFSAAILLQITSGNRKWAWNGSLRCQFFVGHIFYKTILHVSEHRGDGQETILANSAAILQNVKTLLDMMQQLEKKTSMLQKDVDRLTKRWLSTSPLAIRREKILHASQSLPTLPPWQYYDSYHQEEMGPQLPCLSPPCGETSIQYGSMQNAVRSTSLLPPKYRELPTTEGTAHPQDNILNQFPITLELP